VANGHRSRRRVGSTVATTPFGKALRHWRRVRGVSQLDLAGAAATTTRHLSYLETGRSRPSREMVDRLAEALVIPLRERNRLLEQAGLEDGARSILLRSTTGYARRFPLDEADGLLLATHVGGETLSTEHGFPLRLVAPGYRGYDWVKWISEVEVSRDPGWLGSPLPLQ
jgi:transcriptional regulator with XRE-family HTH domain